MNHYYHVALRCFDRLSHDQWMYLLIAIVVFGVFCMRGFGSRSTY